MKFLQKLGKALMLPVAVLPSAVFSWVLVTCCVRQPCRVEISRCSELNRSVLSEKPAAL